MTQVIETIVRNLLLIPIAARQLAVAGILWAVVSLPLAPPMEAGRPLDVDADYDNDGRSDLLIGSVNSVNAIYGSDGGLTAAGDQLWTQDSFGVPGIAAEGDLFGGPIVWGDFDGDGFDDAAIGAPGEDLEDPAVAGAGAVNILYGSGAGLSATGAQQWTLRTAGVLGSPGEEDGFGRTLASGDFDGDGFDDLAISSLPREVPVRAGVVNVLYGSATGLTAQGDQRWSQASTGIPGAPEELDDFGWALSAGDFDDDGFGDLAIAAPGEGFNGTQLAGVVHLLYGGPSGLTISGTQLWSQNSTGVLGLSETGDRFGWAMAAGDFDGDGITDLAIGVPDEDLGQIVAAGSVHVLFGSRRGLAATGNQLWTVNSTGIPGTPHNQDSLGDSLAVGDFNGDSDDDLAIGAPEQGVGGANVAGAVYVIYGGANGLVSAGAQMWHQANVGLGLVPEDGDRFGYVLATGDYDGDGKSELAIDTPSETIGGVNAAGAVVVLAGRNGGLTTSGAQLWWRAKPGVLGDIEKNGGFGRGLGGRW